MCNGPEVRTGIMCEEEREGLAGAKQTRRDCLESQAGPDYGELYRRLQGFQISFSEQWETTEELLVRNVPTNVR